MRLTSPFAAASIVSFLLVACGGASGTPLEPTTGNDGGSAADTGTGNPPPPSGNDAGGTAPIDAGKGPNPPPPVDSGPVTPPEAPDASYPNDPTDGPPTRQTCTGAFGSALDTSHGRLDGTLVAIVQPGYHGCNGDTTHLHLQLLVNGSVYDVATNLDTYFYEKDMAIPDGAYAEGWHTPAGLDYPSFGIHSSQFTVPASQSELAATVTKALENANHLSIFATGYGATGIHDVHRRGSGNDGAIVIDPLSPTSHVLLFCFNTDNF